jgi:predicted dehydrogenase
MSDEPLRVAIVGCGAIGRRRAVALPGALLVACADTDPAKAQALAADTGCHAVEDWRGVFAFHCDVIIVATSHDALAEIALTAVQQGCHVLIEKPGARRRSELEPILAAASRMPVRVRVGFNHRYHRALRKARELVAQGAIGSLMCVHGQYGHGGRIGYEREWRADPVRSGGGELIDQGSHLIDLARWFLGDFTEVHGFADTLFWDMPVEDNAFMLLRTADHRTALLHVSWTEWKNTFCFQIYGRSGKLHIEGLGGSYGVQRLAFHRMTAAMGPPETTIWEYPRADDSWDVEFGEFVADIRQGRTPTAGLSDAMAVLGVVERIYQASGHDHRS